MLAKNLSCLRAARDSLVAKHVNNWMSTNSRCRLYSTSGRVANRFPLKRLDDALAVIIAVANVGNSGRVRL